MGVMTKKCIVCSSKDVHIFCCVKKHKYLICGNCGLLFLDKRPSKKELLKIYAAYTSNKKYKEIETKELNPVLGLISNLAFFDKIFKLQANLFFKNRVDFVKSLNLKVGNVLDVGCGSGQFLELLRKIGWKAYGNELDSDHIETIKHKFGAKQVTTTDFVATKYKKNYFDLVTFWHVFEHISDFEIAIKKTNDILKPGGTIVIEVPSSESMNLMIFRKHWTMLLPPQHLHFWSEKSMKRILKKNNFRFRKTSFPSYYPFAFFSSCVKYDFKFIYLSPLLIPISVLLSLLFVILKRGDVVRFYAIKI